MVQFSKINYSVSPIKEYRVSGCKTPTEKEPAPQVFTATVFAKNTVYARSSFFKILKSQFKIKATQGTILNIDLVEQDSDFEVKNYGIEFVYRTKHVLQNAYKEIRHINRTMAISTLFQEFGSRHKVKHPQIYIIDIKNVADEDLIKSKPLTYAKEGAKYPVFKKISNTQKEFVPISYDFTQ